MTDNSLQIELSGSNSIAAIDDVWARLEQVPTPIRSPYANNSDITKMIQMAQSGLTAHAYNDQCDISIDDSQIVIPLAVYVWVSDMDLNYTLSGPEEMSIGPKMRIGIEKEFSFVLPLTDTYEFDYLVEGFVQLTFETPCYNENGKQVGIPRYRIEKNRIIFEKKIFAVIRARAMVIGYRHTVTITIDNTQASVDKLKQTLLGDTFIPGISDGEQEANVDRELHVHDIYIVLRYDGGVETQRLSDVSMSLDVPENLMNCLSQCESNGSGDDGDDGGSDDSITLINPKDDGGVKEVYYSACDGSILATRKRK